MLLASRSIPSARSLLLLALVVALLVAVLAVVAVLWGPSLAHLVQTTPLHATVCPGGNPIC